MSSGPAPVDTGMDDRQGAAPELAAMAREVIDSNPYLVLGTVDEDGVPRVSPVFFGQDGYRDFYWVSRRRRCTR